MEVKSMPETDKREKIDEDGLSQLALLGTIGSDMEDLNDELAKDQLQGVPDVESNGEHVGEVKEMDIGKENVVNAIVPVDQVAVENREIEGSPCLTASSDPSVVEPSLCPDPSPAHDLSLPPKQEQRSYSPVVKKLSVSPVLRTPARDGYNWRKYGQKQVKSPKGSRSYYRCTYSDCCAKKIECSNDSGNLIEIVNKGSHSHEPLQKNSFSPRETRPVSAIRPVSEDYSVGRELAVIPTSTDPSSSTKENICESQTTAERKRHCEYKSMEETEPKRRLQKDDNSQSSDSVSKSGKKHKFVVHAAGDVGISGDGYKWRKYGNYYRCTSAGCSVRKHIETAVENTAAVIITYKGVHNHDTPVPKERHGPPSSMVLAAATPTSMRSDVLNTPSASQHLVGREREKKSSETLDVGGEKVMESARTLLS